jgi:fibronectin-binding autotransporter adhesin
MNRLRFTLLAPGLTVLVLTAGRAAANDNTWSNAANNLTWDTTSANWIAPTVWTNANVDGAFFSSAGAGTVTLGSAITLRGMEFNANGYTINGSGTNVLTLSAGTTGSLQNGQVQIASGVTAFINATLAGTVGLTQTGIGSLVLEGANTYAGATTVSGGTLQIGNGGAAAGVLPGNVTNNAALVFNHSDTFIYGAITSGTGQVTLAGTGTLIVTGGIVAGGITINSGATLQVGNGGTSGTVGSNGTFVDDGAYVFNLGSTAAGFSGPISGTGTLTQAGTGTLTAFGTSNAYTGGTVITAGTLTLSNSGALPTGGAVTFNNGSLDLKSFSQTIGALNFGLSSTVTPTVKTETGALTLGGNITFDSGTNGSGMGAQISGIINLGGTARTVNINHISGSHYDVVIGAVIGGTGGLTLSSPVGGSLEVTAANTYNGATTVNSGTLWVANTSGSATGTGPVTIASGATLGGGNGGGSANPFSDSTQGFVSGAATVQAGGILAPGNNAAGLLTVDGGVTFQNGSELAVYLATNNRRTGASPADVNTNSRLVTPLDVLFGSSLTVAIDGGGLTYAVGDDYDFFIGQVGAAISLPASVAIVPTDFASPPSPGNFALSQSGSDLILTFAPVPEPGTLALTGLFAIGWVRYWRRR